MYILTVTKIGLVLANLKGVFVLAYKTRGAFILCNSLLRFPCEQLNIKI